MLRHNRSRPLMDPEAMGVYAELYMKRKQKICELSKQYYWQNRTKARRRQMLYELRKNGVIPKHQTVVNLEATIEDLMDSWSRSSFEFTEFQKFKFRQLIASFV